MTKDTCRQDCSLLTSEAGVYSGNWGAGVTELTWDQVGTKLLMLEKTEDKRRGQQRMRWLDGNANSTDMNLSKLQEMVKDRGAWHLQSMMR